MTDKITDDPGSEINIVQDILEGSGEKAPSLGEENVDIFETPLFSDSAVPAPSPTPAPPSDNAAPPIPQAPPAAPAPPAATMAPPPSPEPPPPPPPPPPPVQSPTQTAPPPPPPPAPETPPATPIDPATPIELSEPIVEVPTAESTPPKATPPPDATGTNDIQTDDIKVVSMEDFGSIGGDAPEPTAGPSESPPQPDNPPDSPIDSPPDSLSDNPLGFDSEASDESISALVDDLAVDDELHSAGSIVEARAAKAKDGEDALEQARRIVEQFDGEGEGFVDANELKAALTMLQHLITRFDAVEAQLAQLTDALRAKQLLP